ncbi:MAG: type II toxin-antitoxin system RelB/DinJ family antitoxin [Devosia sp.]
MASAASATVRSRVDAAIKDEATLVLDELGLSVSDLIRMTLTIVAKTHAVPFELKVPRPATKAAMLEARKLLTQGDAGHASSEELFRALDKKAG